MIPTHKDIFTGPLRVIPWYVLTPLPLYRDTRLPYRHAHPLHRAITLLPPCSHEAEEGETRSTVEIAHFRHLVSERRSSLTSKRRNVNLDFEKKRVVDSGHLGLFAAMQI